MSKTKTSKFGIDSRESHDSSEFYKRNIFSFINKKEEETYEDVEYDEDWKNRIYCMSAEKMPIPSNSIGLAFTSPPYNVGKEYDQDSSLEQYLTLIRKVSKEVYRVLAPGGRYVINIANLGRKPYIPLHVFYYLIHLELGFLPMGEIIWQKGEGASGNVAWGSWKSSKAPRLRDIHEYLIVLAKADYSRPDKGISDLSDKEFMQSTLSIWKVNPESAKRVGHPAPFPLELASRVIKLYSYVNDVILDPFAGSGTTCVAAKELNRDYVGFDISPDYCKLSMKRLEGVQLSLPSS